MTGIENSDVKEINLINNELNKYKHHYKMFVRLSVVKMVLQVTV